MEYESFDLLIRQVSTQRWYDLSVLESPAGQVSCDCHIDPFDPDLENALVALRAGDVDAEFLQEIGAYLFVELFVGDVATLLRTSIGMVRAAGKGLRIRLRIDAPELESLPWEFLYDPDEDAILALAAETALVRYVALRMPVRPIKSKLPLRILHVIAAPTDLDPLDVARERAIIHDALEEWINQGKVEITVVEHATVAMVNEAMRRVQPHVFHYSGHGLFEDDHAAIFLEDEDGHSHSIGERSFREFFSASRETRLAVLNACETATVSSVTPLVGMAPRLLQRQLSAVVAMQAPVADKAALIFAREFYRSLAHSYPIDAAMAEARKGLYMELGANDGVWGAPVLFLRAQNGQLFDLEAASKNVAAIQPPVKMEPLPSCDGFVGRSAELAYYSEELRTNGSAVICGMAGVGKTALALVLANKWSMPNKVFWHTFHPEDELAAMLWPLAGFLYWNQQPELWTMLQSTQVAGGQPQPPTVMFGYAVQMLRGRGYLLCFDNLHLLIDDPMLQPLVERLRPRMAAGEITLIATSQRVPNFFRTINQLEGVNEADTLALIRARQLSLDPDLVRDLHTHTQGNPEFLLIALDALVKSINPTDLIARLSKVSSMRLYLLNQLDRLLTDEERNIESAVAVLGVPSPRDAIEVLLNADSLRRVLHDLTERYLLTVTQRDWVQEYGQHAILQDFYYDYLSHRLRIELHRRAAEYFELDVHNPVLAARNYQRAQETSRAVNIAVGHVRWSINHYQAHAMARILNDLATGNLTSEDRARVELALGQLHNFLGVRDKAEKHFTHALAAPATDATSALRHVEAYQGMGQLFYNENPASAQTWFQQALEKIPACDETQRLELEAAVQIDLGWALLRLHDFTAATDAFRRSLALLQSGPSHLQIEALIRLANSYLLMSDLENAMQYAEKARELSGNFPDVWQEMKVGALLASTKHLACDWPGAIEEYEQALASTIGLGDLLAQTALHINIGIAQHNLGNTQVASHHLHAGNELAQKDGLDLLEIKARLQLGKLTIQRQTWEDAQSHLEAADALIDSLGTPAARAYLPLVQCARAQLELGAGRHVEALQVARSAVAEAEAQHKVVDLAICRRAEAEVLIVLNRRTEAVSILQQTLILLKGGNIYEKAKTEAVLGLALFANHDGDDERMKRGQQLVAEATVKFTTLGAKLDLEALTANRSPQ